MTPEEQLERDRNSALKSALEYMASEYGKSQQGYFSGAGWAGRILREWLEERERLMSGEGFWHEEAR